MSMFGLYLDLVYLSFGFHLIRTIISSYVIGNRGANSVSFHRGVVWPTFDGLVVALHQVLVEQVGFGVDECIGAGVLVSRTRSVEVDVDFSDVDFSDEGCRRRWSRRRRVGRGASTRRITRRIVFLADAAVDQRQLPTRLRVERFAGVLSPVVAAAERVELLEVFARLPQVSWRVEVCIVIVTAGRGSIVGAKCRRVSIRWLLRSRYRWFTLFGYL